MNEKNKTKASVIRAIFGGSFDPPHHAHVMVVLWALQRFKNLHVTVIPAWNHALGKDYTASFEHRMMMCRKAFAILPQDRIEYSALEKERGGVSYMIDTIEVMKESHPEDELRLLVGSDLVEEIPRWHRGYDVIESAPPLIVPRLDQKNSSKEGVMPMISSTMIRQLLINRKRLQGKFDQEGSKSFEDRITELMPMSVWNYINKHDLYL